MENDDRSINISIHPDSGSSTSNGDSSLGDSPRMDNPDGPPENARRSRRDFDQEEILKLSEIASKSAEGPMSVKASPELENYKRAGFYCAFNVDPENEFRRTLVELEKQGNATIERLSSEADNDIARFMERSGEAKEKLANINGDLKDYGSELNKHENELPALETTLATYKEDFKRLVIEIGSRKETLIQDRQKALRSELDGLNNELEAVVEKRMQINENVFQRQKDSLNDKRKFWCSLYEKYDRNHKEILDKIGLYSLAGFQNISASFLYNVGIVSGGVAGAFLASFAEVNQFASGGVLS